MKCFTLFFALVALLPLSVRADYIFEQSYEFGVVGPSYVASGLDGGDFNNDGIPDFASSHFHVYGCGNLYTFLGNGDCTFNTLQTSYDYILGSITVNDFNNDGYDDLLIGEGYGDYYDYPVESDIVHRLAGNGDGTFTELDTLHISNVWVTSGDLNDDGNIDLVTSGSESGDYAVLVKLGNGDFTFQETVIYEIPSIIRHTVQILGDMDLDGNVDIGILAGWVIFLYGNGDGTFQPAVVVAEHGAPPWYCFIEVGDFNEDGMPDMAATGSDAWPTRDEVLVWDGIGTYLYDPADTIGAAGSWLEVKDFDMDGHLDIATCSRGYNGRVLAGYGDGTFSFDYLLKTVFDETYSVLSEDFDLDGDYDLVFCEDDYGQSRCIRCYRNTTITQGCEEESESSLTSVVLDVSPNPFFTSVCIEVTGYSADSENLQIFDLSGRLVAELEPVTSIGKSVFHWNGESSSGAELPSGIYTARLSGRDVVATAELLKLE